MAHSGLTLLRAGADDEGLALLEGLRDATVGAGDPQAHRVALRSCCTPTCCAATSPRRSRSTSRPPRLGPRPTAVFDAATVAWRHELAQLTNGAHHDLVQLSAQLTVVVERSHDVGSFEPFAAAEQLGWARLRRGERGEALEAFRRAQRSAERRRSAERCALRKASSASPRSPRRSRAQPSCSAAAKGSNDPTSWTVRPPR